MWIRRPASRARSAAPHAWLQIAELAQSRAVHGSGHGRKGSNQQPGDAALVLPLMAEVHGVLEGVRFERPPLNAANTETIRQGSHPTLAVPSNPLVIAAQADHEILRTPPYHPELQPIETCWGIVKNQVARNCDFTMANLLLQLDAAFANVTEKTCTGLIKKIRLIEDEFWASDAELDQ